MLFEKNENKQKEAWVGPFKKKTKNFILSFTLSCLPLNDSSIILGNIGARF